MYIYCFCYYAVTFLSLNDKQYHSILYWGNYPFFNLSQWTLSYPQIQFSEWLACLKYKQWELIMTLGPVLNSMIDIWPTLMWDFFLRLQAERYCCKSIWTWDNIKLKLQKSLWHYKKRTSLRIKCTGDVCSWKNEKQQTLKTLILWNKNVWNQLNPSIFQLHVPIDNFLSLCSISCHFQSKTL